MSAAAALAIVVAVGEAHSPSSVALLAAAEESLGSTTSIRLVELGAPTKANTIRVERELGASAAVVVLWKEQAHLHATLRLHVARADRWTMRSMTFGSGDTLAERGRTVGLAVASMMPERPGAPGGAVAQPSPAPSVGPAQLAAPPGSSASQKPLASSSEEPPTPEKSDASERPLALEKSPVSQQPRVPERPPTPHSNDPPREIKKPIRVPPPAVDSVRAEAPATRSGPRRLQIGMGAVAAVGIGGSAQGVGGQLEAVWFSTKRLAVRGGLGTRTGPVPALPGSDLVSSAGVGLEWWPLGDPQRGTSSLGIRAGLLVLDHRVTANGESTETQHTFLPGAEFITQFLVGMTPWLSLVGDVGVECAIWTTYLRKGDPLAVVTNIPMLRLVGGLGLRVGF